MRTRNTTSVIVLAAMVFLGLAVLAFSSATATDCIARVKGGSGTVDDPLRVEVEGNAGFTPLIDSLLPFRAIPSIQLSYVGERLYIPGINEYFIGHQKLAKTSYLIAILAFILFAIWLALRLAGKRIAIVSIKR